MLLTQECHLRLSFFKRGKKLAATFLYLVSILYDRSILRRNMYAAQPLDPECLVSVLLIPCGESLSFWDDGESTIVSTATVDGSCLWG